MNLLQRFWISYKEAMNREQYYSENGRCACCYGELTDGWCANLCPIN